MIEIRGQYTVQLNFSSAENGVLFFPVVSYLVDKKICSVQVVDRTLQNQFSGVVNKIPQPLNGSFINLVDREGIQFFTDVPDALMAFWSYGVTKFEPRFLDFKKCFLRFYDVNADTNVQLLFAHI